MIKLVQIAQKFYHMKADLNKERTEQKISRDIPLILEEKSFLAIIDIKII